MATLELAGVRKSFGSTDVIHDVSLDVEDGELVVFVGPSGCGKSTLLRMVAGLETLSAGEIRIGGEPVDHLPPSDRGIAMVFQSYALYPHKDVRGNLGFALKHARVDKVEIARRVDAAAEILGLGELMERRPRELSGGQRQRVAIGRAIVREPDVFLFDEPLSNLDAKLRGDMRVEIKRIHRALEATILYVTHDQIEAMTLADRIVLLNGGRIEQTGTPTDLYRDPDTLFAARFIGSPEINAIPVEVTIEEGRPVACHGSRTFVLPAEVLRAPQDLEAETLNSGLRQGKRRVALLAALADLGGAWSLEEVTGALTGFADAATQAALRVAVAAQIKRGDILGRAVGDEVCVQFRAYASDQASCLGTVFNRFDRLKAFLVQLAHVLVQHGKLVFRAQRQAGAHDNGLHIVVEQNPDQRVFQRRNGFKTARIL